MIGALTAIIVLMVSILIALFNIFTHISALVESSLRREEILHDIRRNQT